MNTEVDDDVVKFNCPTCGHRLKARVKLAGKRVACSRCKSRTAVPISVASHPPRDYVPDMQSSQLSAARSNQTDRRTKDSASKGASGTINQAESTPSDAKTYIFLWSLIAISFAGLLLAFSSRAIFSKRSLDIDGENHDSSGVSTSNTPSGDDTDRKPAPSSVNALQGSKNNSPLQINEKQELPSPKKSYALRTRTFDDSYMILTESMKLAKGLEMVIILAMRDPKGDSVRLNPANRNEGLDGGLVFKNDADNSDFRLTMSTKLKMTRGKSSFRLYPKSITPLPGSNEMSCQFKIHALDVIFLTGISGPCWIEIDDNRILLDQDQLEHMADLFTRTSSQFEEHAYSRQNAYSFYKEVFKARLSYSDGAKTIEELFLSDDGPPELTRTQWTFVKRHMHRNGQLGVESKSGVIRFRTNPIERADVYCAMLNVFRDHGFVNPTGNQLYRGVVAVLGERLPNNPKDELYRTSSLLKQGGMKVATEDSYYTMDIPP